MESEGGVCVTRVKECPQQGRGQSPQWSLLQEGQIQKYAVLEHTRHQDLEVARPSRGMWVQVLTLCAPETMQELSC